MTEANSTDSEAYEVGAASLGRFGAHVVLSDPELLPEPGASVFALGYWRSKAAVTGTAPGRGSVWFVRTGSGEWALRHFRRGGLVGRLIEDHYLWTGENRVRAFSEWRLLARMYADGLPVPRPVAASYVRERMFYTCNLITCRLPNTRTLTVLLTEDQMETGLWRGVGRVIRQFHELGIDHADLNAHNILIDNEGQVFLIDFDRARRRAPGAWRRRNLSRLKRSLIKVCPPSGQAGMESGWQELNRAYDEDPATV